MTTYADIISRDADTTLANQDPLVPTPVSAQIIQEMVRSSAVLTSATRVPMSSRTNRQPVLSVLPQAYFVGGDTGLKRTGAQDWENLTLVAEELAVILPIPQAYLDDVQIPIWDEVRPRVAEAFGQKIDAACLFGDEKPATWGDALVPTAISKGFEVVAGTGDDLAVDVAAVAGQLSVVGFNVNRFVSGPGLRWQLIGMRSSQGIPIYAPPAGDQPGTLYGFALNESLNGGWHPETATLLAGDWAKAVFGVRQDMTFRIFTEGVITDGDGKVILNLMQQDSVALRCVMRCAWAVANPVTRIEADASLRFPFGVVTPAGS